jgi:hypothetical protein
VFTHLRLVRPHRRPHRLGRLVLEQLLVSLESLRLCRLCRLCRLQWLRLQSLGLWVIFLKDIKVVQAPE